MTDTSDDKSSLSRRKFIKLLGLMMASAGMAVDAFSMRAPQSSGAISSRSPHLPLAPAPPPSPPPPLPAIAATPHAPTLAAPEDALIESVSADVASAVYRGPLTESEQTWLKDAALPLIAPAPEDALIVANRLGVQHPSNMCGPLAAHLLNASRIIGPVDPRQFWLLNPRLAYTTRMLHEVFPTAYFFNGAFRTPIDEFDFHRFPLYAGDFMVLYAGAKGTFDHVLAVTRVDSAGRAFSVTNLNIGKGLDRKDQYIIDEVMLYDPGQPGRGQFFEWTNRAKNLKTGLTGGGGFDLWRRWDARPGPTASPDNLQLLLGAVLDQGGQWMAQIKRIGGEVLFERNSTTSIHPASITKVVTGMVLLAMIESQETDLETALQHTFESGRSYADLLQAMLIYSEEPATEQLMNVVFKGLGRERITELLTRWGAPHTTLVPRRSTVGDVVALLEGLYTGRFLSPTSTQKIMNDMAQVTDGDRGRLWALKDVAPQQIEIFNKRASLTDPLIVGDAGIIILSRADGAKEAYATCILGYADGNVTYERLEELIGDWVLAWYRATSGTVLPSHEPSPAIIRPSKTTETPHFQ